MIKDINGTDFIVAESPIKINYLLAHVIATFIRQISFKNPTLCFGLDLTVEIIIISFSQP